ncbi:MAG: hypothetical protein JXQ73_04845 [Phycisphaerae bacterium]|nr:hypothetical protein [Phycisphaerae bacterium]
METVFQIGATSIGIQHDPCSSFGPKGDCRLIVAGNCEPNTLTKITIDSETLYCRWESNPSFPAPRVLYVPETSTLFFGAGTLALTIRVPGFAIIDENVLRLFWSFERKGDFIVQFGELECNLYTLNGQRIDTAQVDPPYDAKETEVGIRFRSDVAGEAWLLYPRQ